MGRFRIATLGVKKSSHLMSYRSGCNGYEQPEQTYIDSLFFAAFHRLSTSRQVGQVLGPIPWIESYRYAKELGFCEEDGRAFADVIMRVDSEYVKHYSKKASKPPKGIKVDG